MQYTQLETEYTHLQAENENFLRLKERWKEQEQIYIQEIEKLSTLHQNTEVKLQEQKTFAQRYHILYEELQVTHQALQRQRESEQEENNRTHSAVTEQLETQLTQLQGEYDKLKQEIIAQNSHVDHGHEEHIINLHEF